MSTVDPTDVLAMLEDGPKKASELYGWIGGPRWAFYNVLARLAAQGVIERHGLGKAARWSLPGADHRPVAIARAPEPPLALVTPALRPMRRVDDEEFVIVWSGVGPLPGAGDAAGLGSTLSGNGFSVGKRV